MSYFVYQGLLFSGLLIYTWQRAMRAGVDFRVAWNLAFVLMLFGFLGGRLFHVFYEYPDLYLTSPTRILHFWEGGFVFYGGFLGALAAAAVYVHKEKESFLDWADFFAPIIALGYAMGRIGCLITGCCYGTYCDAPWAIHGRHPTQLYAFFTEIALYLYLLKAEKSHSPLGKVFSIWLVGHALGRLFMESYRSDFRGGSLMGFSVSTWISLLILACGVALLTGLNKRR